MRKLSLAVAMLVSIVLSSPFSTASSGSLAAGARRSAQGQPSAAACSAPEYRQFDFWIGSWEVYNQQGNRAGSNQIESTLGGCALHESWQATAGGRGHSYTFYDSRTQKWHQTWIDSRGGTLYLDGALEDGRMVLSDGTNRITWTPLPDGAVRQHWQSTADGGKSWTTVFDGEYRRPAAS